MASDQNREERERENGADAPPTNAKEFYTYFMAEFERTYGEHYTPSWKKDCGILSTMLKTHSPEQLEKKLKNLFAWAWDNSWRSKNGQRPTVQTFAAVINEMPDKQPDNLPQYEDWSKGGTP